VVVSPEVVSKYASIKLSSGKYNNSGRAQNTGLNDHVIDTNKKPACRDTFLGVCNVGKTSTDRRKR